MIPKTYFRIGVLFLILHLHVIFVNGQPGISDFRNATAEFHRWYFGLSDLTLIIGAITGILGALRIYTNWQSGKDHHIDAQVMGWFFSCLFLIMVHSFLKALYGI